MHFGQRTGSGHMTVSHTNTPSSQPSISLTHHHPTSTATYDAEQHHQGAPPPPSTSTTTYDVWKHGHDATARQMEGGQGTQREQKAGRTRCARLFSLFLLFTDYPLQLPHLPNTKKATHSRIFCVQQLSCPSPCPQQPNTKACPCGHVLRAGLLPHPLLHSHHPQAQDARVFRVQRLPCPCPRPPAALSCTLTTPRTQKTHETLSG